MTIPTGPASLVNISDEFTGGTNPISLGEYYAGGLYVPNPAPTSAAQVPYGIVPTGGTISIGNFLGLSRVTAGSQLFTQSGSFVVPAGITSLRVTSVGGGGGGGGWYHDYSVPGAENTSGSDDPHAGGGGGAGGVNLFVDIPVTPGETLEVVVGIGGTNASVHFEGTTHCTGNSTPLGGKGGDSFVYRPSNIGQQLALATGGYGGNGTGRDDAPRTDANHVNGGSGNSGTPGNIMNPPYPEIQRNAYLQTVGAGNGSGFGAGGSSHQATGRHSYPLCPTPGGNGAIAIAWGTYNGNFVTAPVVNSNFNTFDLYRVAALGLWNGTAPLIINVTNNATIFSSQPSYPAFTTSTGNYPVGSTFRLINYGTIAGAGGAGGIGGVEGSGTAQQVTYPGGNGGAGGIGGTALQVTLPTTVENYATIGGGGGGGGGGAGADYYFSGGSDGGE